MLRQLLNDENGVIISAELVLILTIVVLAVIVGLSELAVAANTELNDISNAIGAFNQSFGFTGFVGNGGGKLKAFTGGGFGREVESGTTFIDTVDDCDLNTSCEIIVGASTGGTTE